MCDADQKCGIGGFPALDDHAPVVSTTSATSLIDLRYITSVSARKGVFTHFFTMLPSSSTGLACSLTVSVVAVLALGRHTGRGIRRHKP
jgi:hypothetical protein